MTEEAPKKGGKKKLILILVVVLLLVGGGVGAFIFLKGSKGKGGEQAKGESKAETTKGTAFKKLDPFIVNLSDEGGGRYAKVEITLALSDKKVEKEVEEKLPIIRDSIITIISMKKYDDLVNPAGKETLKREIMMKLNSILTTGQVVDIYYTDFVLQ
ncbi:MAG: flagellar basal body-associated FliL family protein [Thermosulfidibacteraceae bacterium]|jgi:flagellar FliL protein